MHRCLQLALLGQGQVAPNPMVGAVLVHNGVIIGEGYHRLYGQAHAEVNCVNAVLPQHRHLLCESTLYVSLEPCAHHGKTPPCANFIVAQGIKRVVVGCRDAFSMVNGKGIDILRQSGVTVTEAVLEAECRHINRAFFCYHQHQRPYVVLKWAQTAKGMVAYGHQTDAQERLHITHPLTNRLVHAWRSQLAAIAVGSRTAMLDNPRLNARFWPGPNPQRVLLDARLQVPQAHHLYHGTVPTLVFNEQRGGVEGNVEFIKLSGQNHNLKAVLAALHARGIQSLLVEGGPTLLQAFINQGVWDEARVITNRTLLIEHGLPAPSLSGQMPVHCSRIATDDLVIYEPMPFT
ncbi:MAG: bifunctional diaminohydroxyphosphoribosylaminopyrimidine deaminase/5-amino-6-(5-phosphoribosylamino)uracil reductase RibD [Bacteroidetes bacterium]|nr:MAG: bifunctional diaminohydroxyphosphoribosylaminopyrimidine deaminase/5-amino-6-(5-phosphoribosylamino)uracil reductase RibD [Bacteroidota bacterium]